MFLRWLLGNTNPPEVGRSPKWSTVRDKFIRANPRCAACGTAKELEAHHVLPYQIRPELELDETNLIQFCRSCHFAIGHGYDWTAWRPDCRKLAGQMLATPVVRK
jgi:hypothetical protein